LIGGGARITISAGTVQAFLRQSYPSTTGANGVWTGIGVAAGNFAGANNFTVTAYAFCAQ
jgi:hypothetical protein